MSDKKIRSNQHEEGGFAAFFILAHGGPGPDGFPKIVRDRYREIIQAKGEQCAIEQVDNAAALEFLALKLVEEAEEYRKTRKLIELGDLEEVIYAILDRTGVSRYEFAKLRVKKRRLKGGFRKGLVMLADTRPPGLAGSNGLSTKGDNHGDLDHA